MTEQNINIIKVPNRIAPRYIIPAPGIIARTNVRNVFSFFIVSIPFK